MDSLILCINSGSSSVKYACYDQNLNLKSLNPASPQACVHRLAHGGPNLIEPMFVTASVKKELKRVSYLAPLHIPPALDLIENMESQYPDALQIACFDTAFHAQMPELAKRFALPRHFFDEGIQRYGFHGLSYEWAVSELGQELCGKSVIAHLGSGCSLVALLDKIPQDTTMGLTPMGGLMMGTRCGDLDPSVLLCLLRKHSPQDLEAILNQQSGLLGVSGISADLEALLKLESQKIEAKQAIDLFCSSVRKNIGSLACVLGGIDTLVFTGGIGENSSVIRQRICSGLEFLGISPERVKVIRANENLMMARHAQRLIRKG